MNSLRIGITFGRSAEDIGNLLWSSGINQNAVLAIMAFGRLPDIAEACVVDCSGLPAPHPLATWTGTRTLTPDDAAAELDIVIEIGARAPPDAMRRLRDRGGKLVSYMAGNAMAMNFEAVSSGLPHGEIPSEVPFDAAWLTPQHWHMNRDLCRITRSDKVSVCPHLWDPIFFDLFARTHALNPFYRREAAARPWRVAIMEPNINVLKTFHLPLLVAEEAYRAAPDLLDRVLLFNTQHLVGNQHFDDLTTALDLYKTGKLFAEGRYATPVILSQHADAVIVHQWENDLNYLYWDVLYSGHPLIHNSPSAQEVGYHYRSFDPADGGRVLADAMARHRERAADARAEAVDYLRRFSIDSPATLARHAELIEELYA